MNAAAAIEFEREMIDHACKGDAAAVDFVHRAIGYFHAADDVIDGHADAEGTVKAFIAGQDLYCHPFFLRHGHALNAVMRTCISTYADSVRWEHSTDPGKRAWADWARHCGMDLVLAVADICGGWDHRRAVSLELRGYILAVAEQEKGNDNGIYST